MGKAELETNYGQGQAQDCITWIATGYRPGIAIDSRPWLTSAIYSLATRDQGPISDTAKVFFGAQQAKLEQTQRGRVDGYQSDIVRPGL